jgi:hypothetical protein
MSAALICQIRAICDHAINQASCLSTAEMAAVEGEFVDATRRMRSARGMGQLAKWTSYTPDYCNGKVYVRQVAGFEGPNGEGPATTFFDVMHESASGGYQRMIASYVTSEAAIVVALQEAIRRNAIYEPIPLPIARSTFPDKGAA